MVMALRYFWLSLASCSGASCNFCGTFSFQQGVEVGLNIVILFWTGPRTPPQITAKKWPIGKSTASLLLGLLGLPFSHLK